MIQQFVVTANGIHAGKVSVEKQGLYYRISCRCRLPIDGIYRLYVISGCMRENLGILVPKGDGFELNTQFPAKRIGAGNMSFNLVPKQDKELGTFVPLSPEEPFQYISRLKDSFLHFRNGQFGILMPKKQEH